MTNKRIVYDGNMENRSIPFEEILSLRSSSKNLDVSVTKGRKKTMRFVGCNSKLIEWLVHELSKGRLEVSPAASERT